MVSRNFFSFLISLSFSFISLSFQNITACVDVSGTSISDSADSSAPDFPLNGFASGHLGIVTPDLSHSYLVVSYRYLQGHPLSPNEQETVMNFWQHYFLSLNSISTNLSLKDSKILGFLAAKDTPVDETYFLKPTTFPHQHLTEIIQESFADYIAWHTLKNSVLGTVPSAPLPEDKNDSAENWINKITEYYLKLAEQEDNLDASLFPFVSGQNSIHFATERLSQLTKILAEDPARKSISEQWIKIQLLFFKVQSQLALKQNAEETLTTLSKMIGEFPNSKLNFVNNEKQYFLSAVDFYSNNPEKIKQSASAFGALAAEPSYLWREWAKYLQQRALTVAVFREFERGDQGTEYNESQKAQLVTIRDDLDKLAKSTSDLPVKNASIQYVDIIDKRLGKLDISTIYNRLEQNLTNLNLLNYLFLRNNDKDLNSNHAELSEILAHETPSLSDWMHIYLSINSTSDKEIPQKLFSYCFQQQAKSSSQVAWLLAALELKGQATVEQQQALVTAALAIPITHPGYFSIRASLIQPYEKNKYIIDNDTRRKIIDEALEKLADNDDYRTKYFFLAQRASLAKSIDDGITHAIFTPSARLSQIYPAHPANQRPYKFVEDYNIFLDQLPLSEICAVANRTLLPQNFRTKLLSIVWVRAILLGQQSLADKIAPELKLRIPALKPYLVGIQKAKTDDERQTQFISALLHLPHLSPFMNLNSANTWPPESIYALDPYTEIIAESFDHTDYSYLWENGVVISFTRKTIPKAADFLSEAERLQQQKEINLLSKIRGGAEWLSLVTSKLAQKHPEDKRYAELLALSVKATRYAPYVKESGASKKAYDTLHKLYPESSWAKETKYYF